MKKRYLVFLLYITMQAKGGLDSRSKLETGSSWEDGVKCYWNQRKTNIAKGSLFITSSVPLLILSGVSFSLAFKNLKFAQRYYCSDRLLTAATNMAAGYISGGPALGFGAIGYRFLTKE